MNERCRRTLSQKVAYYLLKKLITERESERKMIDEVGENEMMDGQIGISTCF